MIRLNKKQIERYIDLFEEDDIIKDFKNAFVKGKVKVFVDYNYNEDYCWRLFATNGYEDELTDYGFRYVIRGLKNEASI